MALRIVREMPLGSGSKGFRFENHEDSTADQKQYEEGRSLEESRFRDGTLGQKIYNRLASDRAA
jgi:hypothetical protein